VAEAAGVAVEGKTLGFAAAEVGTGAGSGLDLQAVEAASRSASDKYFTLPFYHRCPIQRGKTRTFAPKASSRALSRETCCRVISSSSDPFPTWKPSKWPPCATKERSVATA
jgi:hypothetical protein